MRTTLDLDATVLAQLRRRQRQEGRTLGQIANELLARALAEPTPAPPPLHWVARPLGARLDLEDRDAVADLLDDVP